MKWKFCLFVSVFVLALFGFSQTGRAVDLQSAALIFSYETIATTTFSPLDESNYTFVNASNTTVDFNFPNNFYTEDVQLQVLSYSDNIYEQFRPSPTGTDFVGKVYDFTLSTLLSNISVATTSEPIAIVLYYSDADIIGLDERTIAPYRREGDSFVWTLIPGSVVDIANNSVAFDTISFSSFALLASPSTPESSPPSPSPSIISNIGGGGGTGYYSSPPSSSKSSTLPSFGISSAPLPLLPSILEAVDLNGDNRINIIDLSILLYYYKQAGQKISQYDFNKDGRVDLVDVSILIYHWTG